MPARGAVEYINSHHGFGAAKSMPNALAHRWIGCVLSCDRLSRTRVFLGLQPLGQSNDPVDANTPVHADGASPTLQIAC